MVAKNANNLLYRIVRIRARQRGIVDIPNDIAQCIRHGLQLTIDFFRQCVSIIT